MRKEYYEANKETQLARNRIRNKARVKARQEVLSQFPCRACGNTDPSVIQWHHVEPELKDFELFRTAWPDEKFWNEILKCVPLCANCHVKIHKNLICLINPTGFKQVPATASTCALESICPQ